MKGFARTFREQRPDFARVGGEYDVVQLREAVVGESSTYLAMLFGSVALVLLVACANVTNLMLGRVRARWPEIGLRLALGASRWRIVRMMLIESMLVAVVGGVLGALLAWFATDVLVALRPAELPRLSETAMNRAVLGFVLAVSIGTTFFVGLLTAVASKIGLRASELQARPVAPARRQRASHALVVAQLTVCLVLWICAGLLTKSHTQLASIHPGFDYENLLTFSVSLPGTKYERPEGTDRFFRELARRIEALPGVRSTGVVWPLPLSQRLWSSTYTAGSVRELDRSYAEYRLATSDFFETMSIDLLEGRMFSPADARNTVLVNRTLSENAFSGRGAVGRPLIANPWGNDEEFVIAGVAADVRYADLREPPRDTIYFDSRSWSWTDWEVDFVVRSSGSPESLVPPIREALAEMDSTIPLSRVRSMSAYVDDYLSSNRFALMLIGLFSVVSGVLSMVGLYGVVSYSVSRRSREIGIRMAVGADRRRMLSWIYREGLTLVSLGILAGLCTAWGLTRYLSSALFEVNTTDGSTFVLVAGLLTLVCGAGLLHPCASGGRARPDARPEIGLKAHVTSSRWEAGA